MFDVSKVRPLSFECAAEWRNAPYSDFDLQEKPDDLLGLNEFMDLFQAPMVTSCYDDIVYFLPHAMSYVCDRGELARDLIFPVIAFISTQHSLVDEGLIRPCRQAVTSWFNRWTNEFTVEHLTREVLQELGSTREHGDRVWHAEAVVTLLESLVVFPLHSDLAVRYVCSLACSHSSNHLGNTAWFIELARLWQDQWLVVENDTVGALLTDKSLIQSSFSTLTKHPEFLGGLGPTYWSDVRNSLEQRWEKSESSD